MGQCALIPIKAVIEEKYEKQLSIFKDPRKNFRSCKQLRRVDSEGHILARNATVNIQQLFEVDTQLIGSGTYGQVYKARYKNNLAVQTDFAVKIINLKKMTELLQTQLRSELTILSKLDHQNIPKVNHYFEDKNYIYIVMPYIEGKNIQQYLKQANCEKQVAKIFKKVLEILVYIHKQGFVHRDLKPDNILVDKLTQEPILIDFGLSKDVQESNSNSQKIIVGSKAYMAPEILEEQYHSYPCDMWSLGVMLFQILSDEYPFVGQRIEHEIINSPVLYLGPKWKKYSLVVQDLINKLLEKNSSDRITAQQALLHPWFKQTLG